MARQKRPGFGRRQRPASSNTRQLNELAGQGHHIVFKSTLVPFPALKEKRTASLQTVSGTGAVHLGALFLAKFFSGEKTVYLSNPTWANHNQIFSNVGIKTAQYPYFSRETKGLDFAGMKAALAAAPERSVVLLHVCAHNPTGVDPTQEQWKELAAVIRQRNHFPFFDCAYQGFASGDLARDAWAVRYFIEQGFELVVAQSFAKNLGLYGERTP